MSFFDIESQRANVSNTTNIVGYESNDAVNEMVVELARKLKTMRQEECKIGTKKDSIDVRQYIDTSLIPNCASLRDNIEEQLWTQPQEVVTKSKLFNDFRMLKNELQEFERDYADKKLKNILRKQKAAPTTPTKIVRNDPGSSYVSIQVDEQTPLLSETKPEDSSVVLSNQQQQQSQMERDAINQDELDFNTIIQQERSQQISKIHSAVQEVNAIFHQLGSLVSEQGEQVDTIDGNIGQLSNNMQKANDQLSRAEEHQKQRNKCGMVTLIIMVVVVLIVVLAVIS